jgi:hypothetical protein
MPLLKLTAEHDVAVRGMSKVVQFGTASFSSETPVVMESGRLCEIQFVSVGSCVLSRCERTGETAYRAVVAKSEHESIPTIYVVFEGSEQTPIETTTEHPFRVVNLGWVNAGDLQTGQAVETLDGSALAVCSVRSAKRRDIVYNLEVEGFHTYFVGECGLWVLSKSAAVSAPVEK